MAEASPPVAPIPELIALRIAGSSLTRFAHTTLPLQRGDWVAFPGLYGEEPARVAAAPGEVEAGPLAEPWPEVTRRLEDDEVTRVERQAERALEQTAQVARLAANEFSGLIPTGLRYALDGRAICSLQAPDALDLAAFGARLATLLGVPVELEREPAGAPLVGSLGRLRPEAPELATLVRDRLQRLGAAPTLGSRVRFPGGVGQFIAASIPRNEARVRLPDGDEVVVSLDDIAPA
ncbi:MAG TPA: hypothetical protein VFU72_16810 [Nitrolancea sp.]|nr:hypothetical protein [Nitrolancea sp.]